MTKEIYSFTVNKKVKKEVVEEQGDTKITRLVEELQPVVIAVKRPNRQESEAADREFAIEQSAAMRAGIYTKAMVHKTLDSQGFLDSHRNTVQEKGKRLQEIETEFYELSLKEDKQEPDLLRVSELEAEWNRISVQLQESASALESAFQNTAESRAERKVITFLTLILTSIKEGDTYKPIYKGDSFEAKLKHYDALIDSGDTFYSEIGDKAGFVVSLWYLGKAQTVEDFDKIWANFQEAPEDIVEPEPELVESAE
jgi:hypothetical protein